jgi:nucleoside 2-deoxyribosyltransferase
VRIYLAGPLFTPYERAFLDGCAARMRAEGLEVFVPHEHALADEETTPASIFGQDMAGITAANAVVALLDGPMVDDGTACEIGLFHGLLLGDPTKLGTVGLLTDFRSASGEGHRLNLFVHGCVEASGGICSTIDEVIDVLRGWRQTLNSGAGVPISRR